MGIRKVRNAKVTHTGRFPHYRYEQRNGLETLVGVEEQVQVVLEVTDIGPEYGREVVVRMSRTEALAHIRRLTDAIQEGRDKELKMGLPDSETAGEHEHVFRSPHSDEVCYVSGDCTVTYAEHREAARSLETERIRMRQNER